MRSLFHVLHIIRTFASYYLLIDWFIKYVFVLQACLFVQLVDGFFVFVPSFLCLFIVVLVGWLVCVCDVCCFVFCYLYFFIYLFYFCHQPSIHPFVYSAPCGSSLAIVLSVQICILFIYRFLPSVFCTHSTNRFFSFTIVPLSLSSSW